MIKRRDSIALRRCPARPIFRGAHRRPLIRWTGKNPISAGCSGDAITVKRARIGTSSWTLGAIELRHSVKCHTRVGADQPLRECVGEGADRP
ncbi:YjfA family protein [Streptomyces sp. NBC_00441]